MERLLLLLSLGLSLICSRNYAQQAIKLDLYVQEKIYVPLTDELLVWGSAEDIPFELDLLVLDARSGKIKQQFRPGNFVADMAVNGNHLYVATQGNEPNSSELVRYDLPSYTEVARYPLSTQAFQRFSTRAIACSPTDPDLVALILSDFFGNGRELQVLRNGQIQGETVDYFYGFDQLQFRADGQALWTKNNSTTGEEFRFYNLDGSGSLILNEDVYRFYTAMPRWVERNGHLYSQLSTVLDVGGSVPQFVGQHSGGRDADGDGYTRAFQDLLYDETREELIFLRIQDGQLQALRYDPDALHLLSVSSSQEMEVVPFDLLDEPVEPLGDGLNFAAQTGTHLYLWRDCESALPSPVFDPPLDSSLLLCHSFQGDEIIRLAPPTGFDALFTSDGQRWDTLELSEAGQYSLRVLDAEGCLSAPTLSFEVKRAVFPPEPTIMAVTNFGFAPAEEVVWCPASTFRLRASYNGEEADLHWSTGDVGLETVVSSPGVVTLEAISADGCATDAVSSLAVNESSNTLPAAPILVYSDGQKDFCDRNNKTISLTETYPIVEWTFGERDWFNETLTVREADAPLDLRVRVQNENGCWSDWQEVYIRPQSGFPITPQLFRQGTQLAVQQPGTVHEWFYEGNSIPNSNQATWRAQLVGNYQVRIRSGYCWGPLSDPIFVEP